MRVITGKAKGHALKAPQGIKTRPTSDRVKESIFNILGFIDSDAIILDIFAGSGAIGIEFLSRGARTCFFVDQDDDSIKVIQENLKKTKLTEQSYVYKDKVLDSIIKFGQKGLSFDYIFMDPPYKDNLIVPTIERIIECEILKSNGIIICEHDVNDVLPEKIPLLIKVDQRKYGNTIVSFYELGR